MSDESAVDEGDLGRTRPRLRIAGAVVLLVAFLAAATLATFSAFDWRASHTADQRDRDVLEAVSAMAVNLVTLRHDSADDDLARIIDGSTGAFRDQFNGATEGFGAMLADGGVNSTGDVAAAGIVDASDSTATALVAITSTVSNNDAPEGELRVYRMKMTVENVDGSWLVSNVEFVP